MIATNALVNFVVLITILILLWYHHKTWWRTSFTFMKLGGVLDCQRQLSAGARFTNGFLPTIQIRWKLCLVISLLAIRPQQIFAHAMTAQLSCHVQNFVAITIRVEVRVKQNFHQIWIAIEKPLVKRGPELESVISQASTKNFLSTHSFESINGTVAQLLVQLLGMQYTTSIHICIAGLDVTLILKLQLFILYFSSFHLFTLLHWSWN